MIKVTLETFGQRIKNARKEKGLSQKELAARVDLTQQAINHYETNKRGQIQLNIGPMKKIASALGISFDYLMTGKGGENSDLLLGVNRIPVVEWTDFFSLIFGKGKPKMNVDFCETIPLLNGQNENCFGLKLNKEFKQTSAGCGFLKNEIIIVDMDLKPSTGDYVIASIDNTDSIHLRQFIINLDRNPALLNEDCNCDPVTEKTVIHGVVVGSHRKFRD